MKKFLAIIVVAILATSFAFSQNGGTATNSGVFNAEVIIPIAIAVAYPAKGQDLGTIATGDEKNVSGWNATFDVTGHNNHNFTYTFDGPVVGGVADDAVLTSTGAWDSSVMQCNNRYVLTLGTLKGGTKIGAANFTYKMTVSYHY